MPQRTEITQFIFGQPLSHVDVLRTEGGPPLPDHPSPAAVLHKPGIAGRGAGSPRVAAPFPRCDRVILYLHDLRQFPARLHHVRVRARLTVKTIAVASASAVPQKRRPQRRSSGLASPFPITTWRGKRWTVIWAPIAAACPRRSASTAWTRRSITGSAKSR